MKVRMFVVGMAMSLLLVVGAASASAATWRFQAQTTSTLTATGPTTYLRVGSVVLRCTRSTVNLTASTTSLITGPASTSAWITVPSTGGTLTVTPLFSTCDISGTQYGVSCSNANLNADANGSTATAAGDGRTTTGTLSSVNCTIRAAGGVLCTTITSNGAQARGSTDLVGLSGTYTNPNTATSAGASVVINGSPQSLLSTSNSCAAIPSGAANFTSDSTGRAANVTYTIPFASRAASIWVS